MVPEETLEAYAILAAMGPTSFWFQWQTLRELAASFGLGPAETATALRSMLDGALGTFFDGGLTPAQLVDLVPVKPLAEAEPQIRQAYLDVLPRLFAKLKAAWGQGEEPGYLGQQRERSARRDSHARRQGKDAQESAGALEQVLCEATG